MYKCLNSAQRDVLIQCLLKANHKENQWKWGNKIFKCKSGQFVTSLKSLKKSCAKDATIQKVRTALDWLEKWEFLTNNTTKTGRLITICKWDTYQKQNSRDNKQDNKAVTKEQQSNNKGVTTNKKYKKVKNDKRSNSSSFFFKGKFILIWNKYPNKVGKKNAERHFKATVKSKEDWGNINKALENYKKSKRVSKGYVQNGSTWFNQWTDWVQMPGSEAKTEGIRKFLKEE